MAGQKVTPVSAMLKTAELWQQDEKIHQARDMYFKLVENFPDTEEARKAEERLLTMAQELEEKGKVYMAMSIYDRLATPPVPLTGKRPGFILSPMGRR
ncbi:MAG: hypothetical protein QMD88_06885 [Coprothermobacterota bacterium]|nr:hypothetical protein [Coprothermobacterota bacterium]